MTTSTADCFVVARGECARCSAKPGDACDRSADEERGWLTRRHGGMQEGRVVTPLVPETDWGALLMVGIPSSRGFGA